MEKYFQVFLWTDCGLMNYGCATIEEINSMIRINEDRARKKLQTLNPGDCKHAVYAMKTYEDENLKDVRIYEDVVLLDDDEFYKRTDEAWNNHDGGVLIYALHR